MQEQVANIALRGKLIDLKEADEETLEEKWQTVSLENQIKKAGLRKKGFTMPLNGKDITKTSEGQNLVEQFLPDVQLSGWELYAERKSKAWGGAYYRVIKSTEEDLACIQWIYVWTKQRFFISLWMTVLPLFLLAIAGTLIYSYLSFNSAIFSIALIGTIFFLLGAVQLYSALKGLTKGKFYFSNQQLFLLFGGLFWLLLPELYIRKGGTSRTEPVEEAEIAIADEVFDTVVKPLEENIIHHGLDLSYVAILFLIIGIISLILWKWEPPSFTHATHDMDWAPLFIYVKNASNGWQLEKIRYDAFHYFTETLTINELKNKNSITKDTIRIEIPNFWHSYKPRGRFNDWFAVLFGALILIGSLIVAFISFSTIQDTQNPKPMIDILRFVVFPLFLFIGAFLIFTKWLSKIINKKKINLKDEIYHLTENRLRIFWNLRGEEPAFKVRSKLQDPFMDDEDFTTFRDDLEQIVFYSLLPKIIELEQKEFFEML